MDTILRKHHWFWAWEDEKEETWLTAMATDGWHLADISPFGFYTFQAGPKQQVAYRLDYQNQARKQDEQDYLQLFADAGWEHVGKMGGWQYFRKVVTPGETPELFTDVTSKILKYQRLITVLVVFLPIMVILQRNLSLAAARSDWYAIPMFLALILMVIYIYAMTKLIKRISQLKKIKELKQ